MRWRTVIVGLAVLLLVACAAGAATGTWIWHRAAITTAGAVDFTNPLPVPPLAPSEIDADGRRVFDLTAQAGQHDFGTGTATPTWGFNGDHFGPTLRAARGERVAIRVRNDLDATTSVHWHGMHLPAAMDGGPHQEIPPGGSWTPTWRIDQPAATLWYHPHPHGQTEAHVYRGLAGMFLIDDEPSAALDLPDRYGVDDIPVIVQDKRFTDDGRLDDRPTSWSGMGILGDTVTVNGTVQPYLDVTAERVRLRLLNGSTARIYHFGFDDDRRFALIGTDGGLLAAPHHTDRITLSPGERAEIVVDVAPGERPVLRSYPPPLQLGHPFGRFSGGEDTLDILQLRAADPLEPAAQVPDRLVEVPRLPVADVTGVREFRLSGREINGQRMDMDRIDFAVETNSVEVWQVRNDDGGPHNFHLHDVQFQVLSVDGVSPPPQLQGWKDTVYLPPHRTFALIIRFGQYADPDLPYMYHCHLLSHEDGGMMGQFVVVEPGQQPGTPPAGHGHAH